MAASSIPVFPSLHSEWPHEGAGSSTWMLSKGEHEGECGDQLPSQIPVLVKILSHPTGASSHRGYLE